MNEQLAKRLRQARLMKKMSLDELKEQMGKGAVSKQALSKYENGDVMPTDETLNRIAKALKMNIEYFYRPYTFDIEDVKVEFRKKQKLGEKEVKALKMQIQDDIEKYMEVEQLLNHGEQPDCGKLHPQGKIETAEEAEDFARQVRAEWQLGESGITNVYTLVEQAGMKIIETVGPEDFDGVSGIINGKDYVIVLNTRQNENAERRRFTTMHEVGHLLMRDCIDKELVPNKVERICHAFASEMLLPGEALQRFVGAKPNLSVTDLIAIQCDYGISIDAIMHRLNKLGMINDSQYKTYNIKKSKSKRYKDYVEESRFAEKNPNKLQSMVYQAVMMQIMTSGKAAQLLNKTEEEVIEDTENKVKLMLWKTE